MTQQNIIRSTVFINESWYQDDDKAKGIKAGTPKPLSISWREAIEQTDGTFLMKAFLQIAGEKVTDITNNVYWKGDVYQSKEDVNEDFEDFDHCAKLHGSDSYDGAIDKSTPITDKQIRDHKVPNERPPSRDGSPYTQPNKNAASCTM